MNAMLRLFVKFRISSVCTCFMFANQIPITVTASNPDSSDSIPETVNGASTRDNVARLCRNSGIQN